MKLILFGAFLFSFFSVNGVALADEGFENTRIGYVNAKYLNVVEGLAGTMSIEDALDCAFASQATSYFANERSVKRRKSLGLSSLRVDPDFALDSSAAVMQMTWIDVVQINRLNRSFGTQNSESKISQAIFSGSSSKLNAAKVSYTEYKRCLSLYKAAGGDL